MRQKEIYRGQETERQTWIEMEIERQRDRDRETETYRKKDIKGKEQTDRDFCACS